MKRYSILLAILLIGCITINAQMMRTPGERAKDLQKQLNLTDAQEVKIESYYIDLDTRIKNIIDKNNGNMEKAREVIKQEFDKTQKQIEKILTAQQKEKYNKLNEEFQKKMGSRPPDNSKNPSKSNK
jgi:periplasmic protein CpxP/Spy